MNLSEPFIEKLNGVWSVKTNDIIIRSAFQKIYGNDGVYGYEALSRIQCLSSGNFIRPDLFFDSISDYKNKYVTLLRSYLNQCHILNYKSIAPRNSKLFLNITPDFPERIACHSIIMDKLLGQLSCLDFNPGNIVFEVVEKAEQCSVSLKKGCGLLVDSGFALAVDDFGDERSDTERVKLISPSIVKIGRSFYLETISDSPEKLQESVDYFHSIGSKVLVEGIEDESHVEILKSMGVDYFQGFLFHKPELFEVEVAKGVN